jgi:hypothetical protein
LAQLPSAALERTLRGDFSRRIAEVFGDQPFAAEIRRVQFRRAGEWRASPSAFIKPIRDRYEVTERYHLQPIESSFYFERHLALSCGAASHIR